MVIEVPSKWVADGCDSSQAAAGKVAAVCGCFYKSTNHQITKVNNPDNLVSIPFSEHYFLSSSFLKMVKSH